MEHSTTGAGVKSNNDVLKAAVNEFRRGVEITRDVRFQANLRLSARQRSSAYVVSFLSLYVIALSLLPNILELKPFQSQILLACSIILSVFVIFTSLIDGAQNFYHQGELLHQCARKIATIQYNLKDIDVDGDPEKAFSSFDKLRTDYAKALDDCPINHANVDFFREIVRKPHLFPHTYKLRTTTSVSEETNSVSEEFVDRSKTGVIAIRFWFWLKATFFGRLWIIPHCFTALVIGLIVYMWVIDSAVPIGSSVGYMVK